MQKEPVARLFAPGGPCPGFQHTPGGWLPLDLAAAVPLERLRGPRINPGREDREDLRWSV